MSFVAIALWIVGVLFLVFSCIFVSYSTYLFYIHRKYAHLPTPKPFNFFLGHLAPMLKIAGQQAPIDLLLLDWYQQYGPIFVFFVFHVHFVVVLDPTYVKNVFMNPVAYKPAAFIDILVKLFGERLLGRGLVTECNYDAWKLRRSLYNPVFNKVYLKSLGSEFNECADRLIQRLTPLANGKTAVPMKKQFALTTLDVISSVAFGSDCRTWSSGIPELKTFDSEEEMLYLLKHTMTGVEIQFLHFGFEYIHPFKARSYRRAARAIRTIGREVIQSRIRAIEQGETVPSDILTQILKSAKSDGVTSEDLVNDFATFFIAGQETTSNLLTFALILISQHPSVYQQLMEEIEEVLGDKDCVSPEDADKLQYTLQVLEETLRLFPPVGGLFRGLGEGIVLGGYKLPKDTIILASTFAACRLPENFEEPEKFDPSRFSPDRPRPDPFVYFPFARGHRSCIGSVFALLEARIILARFLKKFQFILPPDYKLEMITHSTIQPKGHVACTLKPLHFDCVQHVI